MEQYSKFCQILTSTNSNLSITSDIQKLLNSENDQLNNFIKSYINKKDVLKSTTAKSLYSKFSNEGYDKFANVLTNIVFFKYYFSLYKDNIHNNFNGDEIIDCFKKMYYCLKDAFTDYTNLFLNTTIVTNLCGNHIILSFLFDKLFLSAKLYDENIILLNKKGSRLNLLEDCGKELNNLFSRSQKIDNYSIIFVCCLNLIKVYFKLRTYRNCETLIGWVDRSEINFDKEIPLIYSCAYNYYTGRMNLYKKDIEKSKLCFEKAFMQIKNVNTKNLDNYNVKIDYHNKRLVLEYLIVLNLFYGKEPSKQLLSKYNLLEYSNLIKAIKYGDIEMFDNQTLLLEDRMASLGTFLLVEKLKGYVVRNLINRIYNMMDVQSQQYPKLCLNLLYSIFSKFKYFEDYEEFEFYLISVLYKGLIKGYIHQEKKELVFSKKNPFPEYKNVLEDNSNRIF